MDVAIIDYKMGNLFSVKAACEYVGLNSVITNNKEDILNAKSVILPGVGAFGEATSILANTGLNECIYKFVETKKPLLGICLGMQLLFNESEEFGNFKGLSLLKGNIKKFKIDKKNKDIKFPVPHVGWNKINVHQRKWDSTFLSNNLDNEFMYFVHSYYVVPENEDCILSTTIYGDIEYCSSVSYKNIHGVQFHPEKSGINGLKIYKQFKNLVLNNE